MAISRRALLGAGLAGAAGAVGVAGLGADRVGRALAATTLRSPQTSGIEHVVVVMMENRSFDHLLGWVPRADGRQAGLSYVDRYAVRHATHHMTVPNNCGFSDPDHSYEGGRIQLDGGRCDGFLRSGLSDVSAIGYYTQADLPFLGQAATQWTTFDRYFAATMAETYPNRFYMHAAQTDRLHNSTAKCTLTTIWDRLAAAGVSHNYFFSDVPFTALWYEKHLDISLPYATFLTGAALGRLPAVSFVDPRFEDENSGTSNDDHPHADLRAGEAFLNEVYDAVRTSPAWDKTVLVITFDEWGGFFDHVRPASAPDNDPATALRGFRVPTVVISPYARRGYVGHNVYDHTSILKLIEWRWGLPALTRRDAAARNIAEVLDFDTPVTSTPTFSVPAFVPVGCSANGEGVSLPGGTEDTEWRGLKKLAIDRGWVLPR